jgi:hypothetical protein
MRVGQSSYLSTQFIETNYSSLYLYFTNFMISCFEFRGFFSSSGRKIEDLRASISNFL